MLQRQRDLVSLGNPSEREHIEGLTFQSEAEYFLPDDVPWPAQDFASEIGWSQVKGIIARTLWRERSEHQDWLPVKAFGGLAETIVHELRRHRK